MKLLTTKNALLITAFLGCLPHLALGVPVTHVSQVADPHIDPRSAHHPLPPPDAPADPKVSPRNEEDFDSEIIHDVPYIEARGFDPIEPPHPPPLPRPAPAPAPVVVPRPPVPDTAPVKPPSPARPAPPPPRPNWQPIPIDNTPGKGAGVGADAKPMDAYTQSGQRGMTNYVSVLKSDKPDTPIVQTEAELAKYGPNQAFLDIRKIDGYQLIQTKEFPNVLKGLKNFKSSEVGFNVQDPKLLDRVFVVKNKDTSKTINRGTYDSRGNFIVYEDAFKENNKNIPNKLPLNEMGMQNFIHVAGDNSKNFKAAFLMNIQNKEFWAITRENYNDMRQPFDQVLSFDRGTPQFDRYMGSPNFNSKLYSFGNHHNAIGNKVPKTVIVVPKQAQLKDSSGELIGSGELDVAVVFGDA